jgi:hypothetical protein
MRNKMMMAMGLGMVAIQILVFALFGLLLAYDAGSTVMIAKDTATMIVAGTFFVTLNIAAIGFIIYGALD